MVISGWQTTRFQLDSVLVAVCTTIKLALAYCVFRCRFTVLDSREREIQRPQGSRRTKWKYFECTKRCWTRPLAILSKVLNKFSVGSRGLQIGNLTQTTRGSSPVRIFIPARHVMDWPPWSVFQPLPTSYNSTCWGNRIWTCARCSNHLIWLRQSGCLTDWVMQPENLSPN